MPIYLQAQWQTSLCDVYICYWQRVNIYASWYSFSNMVSVWLPAIYASWLFFVTWLLNAWQHSCQPIRSFVGKLLLTNTLISTGSHVNNAYLWWETYTSSLVYGFTQEACQITATIRIIHLSLNPYGTDCRWKTFTYKNTVFTLLYNQWGGPPHDFCWPPRWILSKLPPRCYLYPTDGLIIFTTKIYTVFWL